MAPAGAAAWAERRSAREERVERDAEGPLEEPVVLAREAKAAVFQDHGDDHGALVGRGILDVWRGGGVEGYALDTAGGGVRLLAENLEPGASWPLSRALYVLLPGDASVAARLAHRGEGWFVLLQSPGRLGCSAVGDGGETLLGDVLVLEGAGLTAPLSRSPAGDAFVRDHTGPVRVGGRNYEGPATLVATLGTGCRATVIVDLPHANGTAAAPSTLTEGAREGTLYVAQNFTTPEARWSEVRAIAP